MRTKNILKATTLLLIMVSIISITYSLTYSERECLLFCYLLDTEGTTTLTNNPQPIHTVTVKSAVDYTPDLSQTYFKKDGAIIVHNNDFTRRWQQTENAKRWYLDFTASSKTLETGSYTFSTVFFNPHDASDTISYSYDYIIDTTSPTIEPPTGSTGFIFTEGDQQTSDIDLDENIKIKALVKDIEAGNDITDSIVESVEVVIGSVSYPMQHDSNNIYTIIVPSLPVGSYEVQFKAQDNLQNQNDAVRTNFEVVCLDEDNDGAYQDIAGCTPVDCDDNDPTRYPGADETCQDGIDNDCSGEDSLCACSENDGDGYYGTDRLTCPFGPDCNDNNDAIHPGAVEICMDGIDNDCSEGDATCPSCFNNNDRDAYCADDPNSPNYDCVDTDPAINPGATEVCEDGVDNDCSGGDAECTCDNKGLEDTDRDNFCKDDPIDADCDDQNAEVNPGADEICNGIDDDCDGTLFVGEEDSDDDGYYACSTLNHDCNDQDDDINPAAEEICGNQIDENCDGSAPECSCSERGLDDNDGDNSCSDVDCDDSNPSIHPGANDICLDGIDQDCYGGDAACTCVDSDGDTYFEFDTTNCRIGRDCNDKDAAINPDADEICTDGIDQDCDGIDLTCPICNYGYYNIDRDGFCSDIDCDDRDVSVHPLATEICEDGKDNDCSDGDAECTCDNKGLEDTDRDNFCKDDPIDADCNDQNAEVNPGADEICNGIDDDCDGSLFIGEDDVDGDGYYFCSVGPNYDCDDNDMAINPSAEEICGNDIDENCDDDAPLCSCVDRGLVDSDNDGYCGDDITNIDCDDNNAAINPGANDICYDGIDQDCQGGDAACACVDSDGDTYYEEDPINCRIGRDCNDNDAGINPNANEICTDGIDQDCDGNDLTCPICNYGYNNVDRDGYCSDIDCDDLNAGVSPGSTEVCDGIDNDCDGNIDEEVKNSCTNYATCAKYETCADCLTAPIELCNGMDDDCDGATDEEVGYICYDYRTCQQYASCSVCPDEPVEQCNGLDDNCDGVIPDNEKDDDLDGFSECEGDCADNNADIHPDAVELCNNIDDDCNPDTNEGSDEDNDGKSSCDGDCDDSDPNVYPEAPEICDGKDSNCDQVIPDNEKDSDGDGVSQCEGDCNEDSADIYPGAIDICGDGVDQDCDFRDGCTCSDIDKDGFLGYDPVTCTYGTDCDDTNVNINPSKTDICGNSLDEDCDGIVAICTDCYPHQDFDNDASCSDVDCDDTDPNRHPGAYELCDSNIDYNCDGKYGICSCENKGLPDADNDNYCSGDTYPNNDCRDNDASVHPGADEGCNGIDNDCDTIIPASERDNDGDGIRICQNDCDDENADKYPGNQEVCDGFDNDCDGEIDEGLLKDCKNYDSCTTYQTCSVCAPTPTEICDGLDNDCDGAVDEGLKNTCIIYSSCTSYETCSQCPAAPEEICDGMDNDCDGLVDEGLTHKCMDYNTCTQYDSCTACPAAPAEVCDGIDNDCDGSYLPDETDQDNDGIYVCQGDCDDSDAAVHPGAEEICQDGKDNDCVGGDTICNCVETDGDGFYGKDPLTCPYGTDCNDNDPNINPAADEICQDGIDNDCVNGDSICPSCFVNVDRDSYCGDPAEDCDDNDPTVYPGATEICEDGKDNDCSAGDISCICDDKGLPDNDKDNYCDGDTTDTDCDDKNKNINPGKTEICNGFDDNCDSILYNGEMDVDGDGYMLCSPEPYDDCDDNDESAHPGATEICDEVDNDCDGEVDEGVKNSCTNYATCTPYETCGDCSVTPQEVCDGIDNDCNGNIDEGVTHTCMNYATCTEYDTCLICPTAPQEICDGLDNDCDGNYLAGEVDQDGDGVYVCQGDCDDTDPNIYPGADEICQDGKDNDCIGGDAFCDCSDYDGDGFHGFDRQTCRAGKDCEDRPAGQDGVLGTVDDGINIYPGADEICSDQIDNDCMNGDLICPYTCIHNRDRDAYCADDPNSPNFDCDDSDEGVHPGATEVCEDGKDNDCIGGDAECTCDNRGLPDVDGDNYCDGDTTDPDCDDKNKNINPGKTEICNGFDDNCDNALLTGEEDTDIDSYLLCATGLSKDCNDDDATMYPGNTEICDGKDNNCDGDIPLDESDTDSDSFLDCNDCGPEDIARYPGAPESCNGLDDNCDGQIPENEIDSDSDGFSECNSDCDDNNPNTHPGAAELCNGLDDDCNPSTDENVDGDNDGKSSCQGDCDNSDPTVYPGATEICDGKDNNCDGILPDNEKDNDADGVSICEGDCNDYNAGINPQEQDICQDGIDQDCSGIDAICSCIDNDGDKFYAQHAVNCPYGNDCDDNNPGINPNIPEICTDGIDQNCDGMDLTCPACFTNNDQDGFCADNPSDPNFDCDDSNHLINPGAPEICGNQVDENCDGDSPICTCENRGLADQDADSYCLDDTERPADCDDTNPNTHPGKTEICNNQYDEDCSGDAWLCQDNNICTTNTCGSGESCDFQFNTLACEDNLFCTVDDQCSDGNCQGTPRDCSDTKACTTDTCDEDTDSCVHSTAGCTCTVDSDCEDGDVCTDNTCDANGYCNDPIQNTAGCNDGDLCTINDRCSAGVCSGTTKDCGDGNTCTVDSCDPYTGGCRNEYTCDCTTDTECQDGNLCTDDYCIGGSCVHLNNNAGCDDNNACTQNDQCNDGQCIGSQKDCSDGKTCTTDSCNPGTGCEYDSTNCVCYSDADCDDGNICTDNECDTTTNQCKAPTYNTDPCNDNMYCTKNDICTEGQCIGQTGVCDDGDVCTSTSCDEDTDSCTSRFICQCSEDAECNDNNVCTNDKCLEGSCQNVFNSAPCDDKKYCTVGDQCSEGICLGTARNCQDSRDCTSDSCSEDNDKCVYDTTGCDCSSDIECNDFNPCTDNTCDSQSGKCSIPSNNQAQCSDGLYCTGQDVCTEGICIGTTKDCDDALSCTIDGCSEDLDKCVYNFVCPCSTEAECEDNNPCTTEACVGNTCRYTRLSDCDNDNACDDVDLDDDNDGIPDADDLEDCTPTGCNINMNTGVQIDTDGDGVCDGLDQCDNSNIGCSVNSQGCPNSCDEEVDPECVGDPSCVCPTCESCNDVYGFRCSGQECSTCGDCWLDLVPGQKDQCKSCTSMTSCEQYDSQMDCTSNPCISGSTCEWVNEECSTVDTIPPPQPVLDPLPSRVVSEFITITGTAEEGAIVKVYLNEIYVGHSFVEEGIFEVPNVQLHPGENNITTQAEDASNNVGPMSEITTLYYISEGPSITTSEPGEGEIKNSVDQITAKLERYLDTPIDFAASNIILRDSSKNIIAGILTNNGVDELYFTPTLPLEDDVYNATVTAVDDVANAMQYYIIFTVSSQAPMIEIDIPKDNDVVNSRSINFKGTIKSQVSTVRIVKSTLEFDNNKHTVTLSDDNTYDLTLQVGEDGEYDFNITSENELVRIAVEKGTITIDTTGPGGCVKVGSNIICKAQADTGDGRSQSSVTEPDKDGDGMPDAFEYKYWDCITCADPDEDSDGDGIKNSLDPTPVTGTSSSQGPGGTVTLVTNTDICKDSDNGIDYYVQGTAEGPVADLEDHPADVKVTVTDFCTGSDNALYEYACTTNEPYGVYGTSFTCPNSCHNGACLP